MNNWADKRNLLVYKIYKEIELRSFQIVDAKGRQYQLWVDAPDENELIGIHVWDLGKRRKDFIAQKETLFEQLEIAYLYLENWKSD